jgi:hypothetical protein
MPGARCARSRVCRGSGRESTRVSQVTPESPGIPRAMVLTVSFVLSPATGLSCHRRLRTCIRKLDTSVGVSGPHDFSVRLSALRPKAHPRPPHPAPRFVTLRNAPLWDGTGRTCRDDLPDGQSGIFLQRGLDRKFSDLPVGQISRPSAAVRRARRNPPTRRRVVDDALRFGPQAAFSWSSCLRIPRRPKAACASPLIGL